ncbi:MAG: DUF2971 domain-containing protein, partial [Desulfuromonadales bacterium]|nr:DUF2971 domain-containing protein [Desulfuromonadales bacterium]
RSNDQYMLWSLYASSHRGLCLHLDEQLLRDTAKSREWMFTPVDYSDNLPSLSDMSAAKSAPEQNRLFVGRKGRRWESEQEIRIIAGIAHNQRIFTLPQEVLVGVTFGREMPSHTRECIIDWIRQRPDANRIRLFECVMHDRHYDIATRLFSSNL